MNPATRRKPKFRKRETVIPKSPSSVNAVAESSGSIAKDSLERAIEAIENSIPNELEDWGLDAANGKLNERESAMYAVLSKVYQLAHAFNQKHLCYHVHGDWRKLAEGKAARKPGADAAPQTPA